MITYSTNFMGPISNEWYLERGLDPNFNSWKGGRIDIYGLSEIDYSRGRHEYYLPVMHGACWNMFSKWIEKLEHDKLFTYSEIISMFEASFWDIKWADEWLEIKK